METLERELDYVSSALKADAEYEYDAETQTLSIYANSWFWVKRILALTAKKENGTIRYKTHIRIRKSRLFYLVCFCRKFFKQTKQ